MTAGDLPPSSSVTGVRLAAAAAITSRPTAVEPVNSRWSKGSAEKARRHATRRRCTTQHLVGGEVRASERANSAPNRGVSSDILSITRLPAASAPVSGPTAR